MSNRKNGKKDSDGFSFNQHKPKDYKNKCMLGKFGGQNENIHTVMV